MQITDVKFFLNGSHVAMCICRGDMQEHLKFGHFSSQLHHGYGSMQIHLEGSEKMKQINKQKGLDSYFKLAWEGEGRFSDTHSSLNFKWSG